jgi:hypothetical protein
MDRIEVRGVGGKSLGDKWRDGPSTYLGVMTHDYPNMLMVAGPQSVSGSTNYPRAIETGVDWVTEFLAHVSASGATRFEATAAAEEEWQEHVVQTQKKMPFQKSQSWFTGYNSNLPGREAGKVRYHAYWGGAPRYKGFLDQAAAEEYRQVEMD